MENKGYTSKQRLVLINRDFQLRYTGAAVLVGLLSTIMTTSLILYPLYQFKILRIAVFLPWPIILVMLLAAVLNVMLVGFMGILLTHKIAGPMYSLVRHFRRVEDGRWFGEMKVRDGDDLRYVVRNFNAMLDSINKASHHDLNKLHEVRSVLVSEGEDDAEKINSALVELKTLEGRLRLRLHADGKQD